MLPSRQVIRCQRCGGRLYLDSDVFGAFLACIQCGAVRADSAGANLKPAVDKSRSRAVREKLPAVVGR